MTGLEENLLERSLRLAASDPAARPDFYTRLLNSDVFVLTPSAPEVSESRVLSQDESVQILNWTKADGSPVLPFFSSVETLQQSIEEPSGYMGLPARVLFEMTRGAALVLNPRSEFGKEFLPNEIGALLSNGTNKAGEAWTAEKDTQVLVGQPSSYPSAMVEALGMLLAKRPTVRAAYLAQMFNPARDKEPHLLIGIEADEDIAKLSAEIGAVATDALGDGRFVDVMQVDSKGDGVSQYLRESGAIYERPRRPGLRNLFGFGLK